MDNIPVMALAATLFTWFVTMLGSLTVIFFKSVKNSIMNVMLGFASGVMIAASFWSLLQPAIEKAQMILKTPAYIVATAGFLSGAVFMWASDKTVSLLRQMFKKTPDNLHENKTNRIIMLILSITLHNIPEGLAVGVAFGALKEGYTNEALLGAISIAVGIALQNFPEGAAVSLPLRREGYSRKRSFFWGQASGMVEPVAGFAGAYLVVYMDAILPFALSFAAGAMILVAVHELIPECQKNKHSHPYSSTAGIVAGFAVMMLLDVMLG